MATKIYVLDTTVLIENPDYMYRGEGIFVIPTAVIKEIDGLKNNDQEDAAKAARKVARTLDRLGSYGDLSVGVRLSTGGVLRVYTNYVEIDDLNSKGDNRIVGAALALKKETGGDVELVTTDINMRTVARVYGIKPENPDCGSVLREDTDMEMVNKANNLKRRIKRAGVIAITSGISALVIMLLYLAHIPPRHSIFDPLLVISLGSTFWWGGYYFFLKSPTTGENKPEYGLPDIGPKEVFDPRYSGLGCNIHRDE